MAAERYDTPKDFEERKDIFIWRCDVWGLARKVMEWRNKWPPSYTGIIYRYDGRTPWVLMKVVRRPTIMFRQSGIVDFHFSGRRSESIFGEAEGLDVDFWLLVEFMDGSLYLVNMTKYGTKKARWGGERGRNDPEDLGPLWVTEWEQFHLVWLAPTSRSRDRAMIGPRGTTR